MDKAQEEKIHVSVRLRPLSDKELSRNDQSDWECINESTIIFRNVLPERSMFPTAYTFDRVFRDDCDTKRVYEEGAREVALSVLSGVNASIFAYGQTSSGKTYTMTGVTEYAMADIYDYIERHTERDFVLKFSALEIYNEAVKDLLSGDNTPLRLLDDPDRGTIVDKLTEEVVTDWEHMQELLSVCEAQRQIGETSLNAMSSRSHQILRLSVESTAREFTTRGNSSSLTACVNFVDLAGSERASQTLSAGTRLKEGCHINRSLLTLGTVIRKLSKGRGGHVPYRDSKLTRILQSSLGGNARTTIICTMSPARCHVEQSRNTLLFACCAKEVATNAQVNVVMSDKALVKHLQRELERLEAEVRGPPPSSSGSPSEALLREKDAQIQKMEMEMRELTRQRDLAQSQLNEWLRASTDRDSQNSDELGANSSQHDHSMVDDELFSLYETSSLNDFGFNYCNTSGKETSAREDVIQRAETRSNSGVSPHSSTHKGQEESCRDVRCIEIDEVVTSRSPYPRLPIRSEKVEEVIEKKKTVASTPWLSRSISCRPSLMQKWLTVEEPTPRGLTRDHTVKSAGIPTTPPLLPKNGRDDGKKNRVSSEDDDGSPQQNPKHGLEHMDGVMGIHNFMAEMKGMAKDQSHIMSNTRQVGDDRDEGISPNESISWEEKFEQQRWEIIKLWDMCKVSLLHRTYFFLLFKGDPADSIYMEVELRRMCFLRRVFTEGGVDKALAENGIKITPASCVRALQRERDMLAHKLQKRLAAEERVKLYQKWGIPLESKQRKAQLSRMLWRDTMNMEHIKESAAVVATLVGLLEPNQTIKEMFQLSFVPQQIPTRSQSWKHGMSSII
ncbi:kinesin-like protein KIN-7C [Wolffia australiana]